MKRSEVWENAAIALQCLKDDILDRGFEGSAEAIMKYIDEEIKEYTRLSVFKKDSNSINFIWHEPKDLKADMEFSGTFGFSHPSGAKAKIETKWESDKIEELDLDIFLTMHAAMDRVENKINELVRAWNGDKWEPRCKKCGEIVQADEGEDCLCANCAG